MELGLELARGLELGLELGEAAGLQYYGYQERCAMLHTQHKCKRQSADKWSNHPQQS